MHIKNLAVVRLAWHILVAQLYSYFYIKHITHFFSLKTKKEKIEYVARGTRRESSCIARCLLHSHEIFPFISSLSKCEVNLLTQFSL